MRISDWSSDVCSSDLEQALHRLPRLGADVAQASAALADHDRLLAVALDPDHRAAPQHRAVAGERFDLHRGRVRQLGTALAHQLFAPQFAGDEALALFGDLVFAIERRLPGPQPPPPG